MSVKQRNLIVELSAARQQYFINHTLPSEVANGHDVFRGDHGLDAA
jgi:hypothetical protein